MNKDDLYNTLNNPTLESFRDLLKNNSFESSHIDFKETWIEKEKLVKLILSIANSGGGCIVIGVTQNTDNTFTPSGIVDFLDEADFHRSIKSYIPKQLLYSLHNFHYNSSEYEILKGKKFQLITVKDIPQHLPYICEKDGNSLKNGDVYIRKGTEIEKANSEEMVQLIRRNIASQPRKNNYIPLEIHLSQLKTLYDRLEHRAPIFSIGLKSFSSAKIIRENEYPKETYNEFVARMINMKKERIEEILDL